jgi:transposase
MHKNAINNYPMLVNNPQGGTKMLDRLRIKPKKKSRKYPIKRDEYGRSARQRAFDAFDDGQRPAEVRGMVGISLSTACRYFADWKRQPKNLKMRYRIAKAILKNDREFSAETIKSLATGLGMSQEEVIIRLQRPWALKQLLVGNWPNYLREERRSQAESRLEVALNIVHFFEHSGMTTEKVKVELGRLIEEALRDRED